MAAIPNPKVTMEFALGSVGWQESHVYANNVAVDNAQLYLDMKAIAINRTACLGGNVSFLSVKASQETINRDVAYLKRVDVPKQQPSGEYFIGPSFSDSGSNWTFQSPHLSWPLKLLNNFQNTISITYIAGMPTSKGQNGPGPYDFVAGSPITAGAYLKTYAEYLIASPWGVSVRTWPVGPFNVTTSQPMTQIPVYAAATATSPPTITFGIAQPLSGVVLTPGAWIRVGGLKYTSPQRIRLNGSWQVFNVAAGMVTVLAPRVRVNPNFASIGYAQAATYAFEAYKGYTIDNITHKKRGRVASSPAGRQSSR